LIILLIFHEKHRDIADMLTSEMKLLGEVT